MKKNSLAIVILIILIAFVIVNVTGKQKSDEKFDYINTPYPITYYEYINLKLDILEIIINSFFIEADMNHRLVGLDFHSSGKQIDFVINLFLEPTSDELKRLLSDINNHICLGSKRLLHDIIKTPITSIDCIGEIRLLGGKGKFGTSLYARYKNGNILVSKK